MPGPKRTRWWLVLPLPVVVVGAAALLALYLHRDPPAATRAPPGARPASPGDPLDLEDGHVRRRRLISRGKRFEPSLSHAELYRRILAEHGLLDRNRDRRITAEELTAGLDEAIAHARKNTTERIPWSRVYRAECEAELRRTVARRMDRNGDGAITVGEYLGFSAEPACELARLDRNRDGSVDRAEFTAPGGPASLGCHLAVKERGAYAAGFRHCLEQRFSRRDLSADGKLTWEELSGSSLRPFEEAEFDRMDEDRDGRITREEFLRRNTLAISAQVFSLRDVDRDGAICVSELVAAEENDAREFAHHDRNRDRFLSFDELKGRHWVGTGPDEGADRADFQRRDRDGDGKVSWAEYRSYPRVGISFQAIDTSADNVISPAEWASANREVLAESTRPHNSVGPGRAGYAMQWAGLFFVISFEDLDLDRDRRVTWKEFLEVSGERRPDPKCPPVARQTGATVRFSESDGEVLRATNELIVACARTDDDVRPPASRRAEAKLVALGPAVVFAMLDLMESGSPAASSAAGVLVRLGPRAQAAVPRLKKLIEKGGPTALLAARLLGRVGGSSQDVTERMRAWLEGTDAQQTAAALQHFEERGRGARAYADALLAVLVNPARAEETRLAAARAFRAVCRTEVRRRPRASPYAPSSSSGLELPRTAISALQARLTDPSRALRLAVVQLLAEGSESLTEAATVTALAAAMRDEDARVAAEAARTLQLLGRRAAPAASELARALSSENGGVRLHAARTLAQIQLPELTRAQVALRQAVLRPNDDNVNQAAAAALGELGRHAKRADVAALLALTRRARNVVTTEIALEALGNLGSNARSAVGALRAMVRRPPNPDYAEMTQGYVERALNRITGKGE